ncbi:MAG: hypothetical protein RJA70_929 [Pseudomonadota bacterium]
MIRKFSRPFQRLFRFRAVLRPVVFLAALGIFVLSAPTARAASEADAKALSEKALYDDYLNLRFDDAVAKLKTAIAACETGCSKLVLAQLYRNLGVVLVAGQQNKPEGVQAFAKAILADPGVQLDPDLTTPEVEAALEDARKLSPAPLEEQVEVQLDEPAVEQGPAASGAITHVAPTEQSINTPLPLFIEVKPGESVAKVTAFVRGFGTPKFKPVSFARRPDGFAASASCQDVGGTTGELQYYIVAYDEDGDGVGRVGNEEQPVVVEIKNTLEGDAPHLPNALPPQACSTPTTPQDCPPDFPGCSLGDWGKTDEGEEKKSAANAEFKRHWLSVSLQQDFLLMPASENVCGSTRVEGYECFYGDGRYRDPARGEPGLLQPDGTRSDPGKVTGGFVPATTRLVLGYELALIENLHVGARLGFAFNGGPQLKATEDVFTTDLVTGTPVMTTREVSKPGFLPLHIEARVGYWFGTMTSLVRPHATLSGGVAQVDGKLVPAIVEPRRQNATDCPPGSDASCLQTKVEAWRTAGAGFGAASFGMMVPFATNHGLDLDAKFMMLFGDAGQALAVQLGYMVGF